MSMSGVTFIFAPTRDDFRPHDSLGAKMIACLSRPCAALTSAARFHPSRHVVHDPTSR